MGCLSCFRGSKIQKFQGWEILRTTPPSLVIHVKKRARKVKEELGFPKGSSVFPKEV
jgi:hypothetical protein